MKVEKIWSERPSSKGETSAIAWDICFSPDATKLVAAMDKRVRVVDARTGRVNFSLKVRRKVVCFMCGLLYARVCVCVFERVRICGSNDSMSV